MSWSTFKKTLMRKNNEKIKGKETHYKLSNTKGENFYQSSCSMTL